VANQAAEGELEGAGLQEAAGDAAEETAEEEAEEPAVSGTDVAEGGDEENF
jgi:hypothetical protein